MGLHLVAVAGRLGGWGFGVHAGDFIEGRLRPPKSAELVYVGVGAGDGRDEGG